MLRASGLPVRALNTAAGRTVQCAEINAAMDERKAQGLGQTRAIES